MTRQISEVRHPEQLSLYGKRIAETLLRVDQVSSQQSSSHFFENILSLLVHAVQATSAIVWEKRGSELNQIVRFVSDMEDCEASQNFEKEHIESVFETGEQYLHFTDSNSDSPANMQRCCSMVPVVGEGFQVAALSIVFYAASEDEANEKSNLVEVVAARIHQNLIVQNQNNSCDELEIARETQSLIDAIHRHIELRPLSIEIVNQLRAFLSVDRVSIGVKKGNLCHIKAISNQVEFDRRSNVVKGLEKIAKKVVEVKDKLAYPESRSEMPPSISRMFEKYTEESNAASVIILPLFASDVSRRIDPNDIATTIQSVGQAEKCVGVISIENFSRTLTVDELLPKWDRVKRSVSNSISKSIQYEGLFLQPLWRVLGQGANWYRGHTKRKALIITSLIAMALLALFLIPAEHRIRGEGVIQPSDRRNLYANSNGIVKQLHFEDGQLVRKGDLLISMQNPEIEKQLIEAEGELNEAESKLETLNFQRLTKAFENERQEREFVSQMAATEIRVSSLKRKIKILQKIASQLMVNSPIDGQVVTWNSNLKLIGRPIKRGDHLVSVALPKGEWEIELKIPDKRAGYLLNKWKSLEVGGEPLRVSCVLSSKPNEIFGGIVHEVAPNAKVDDSEKENVVRVRVRIDQADVAKIKNVKPGTTVVGQVHCGKTSLGYAKSYEFFDWVRRSWFKFIY